MKTKNETVERSSLIELILTPEMSIEEFQDICKEKIHAFPNIFRNGEMCSIDTTFRDLGLSVEHNISLKSSDDVGDIMQSFEKIIKDKKTHMIFYYANRPWNVCLVMLK